VSDQLKKEIQKKAIDNLHNIFEEWTSRTDMWNKFKKEIWDKKNQQPTTENELTLQWAHVLWDRTSGLFPEGPDTFSASQFRAIKTNLSECLSIAQGYYEPDSPRYLDSQHCKYLVGALINPIKHRKDIQESDFCYTPEERERVRKKFFNTKTSDQLQPYLLPLNPPADNDKVNLLAYELWYHKYNLKDSVDDQYKPSETAERYLDDLTLEDLRAIQRKISDHIKTSLNKPIKEYKKALLTNTSSQDIHRSPSPDGIMKNLEVPHSNPDQTYERFHIEERYNIADDLIEQLLEPVIKNNMQLKLDRIYSHNTKLEQIWKQEIMSQHFSNQEQLADSAKDYSFKGVFEDNTEFSTEEAIKVEKAIKAFISTANTRFQSLRLISEKRGLAPEELDIIIEDAIKRIKACIPWPESAKYHPTKREQLRLQKYLQSNL